MIFGGWSLSGCNKAFLLKDDPNQAQQLLEIKTPDGNDALTVSDHFTCSGLSICVSPSLDLILGGNSYHLFNHDSLQFVSI